MPQKIIENHEYIIHMLPLIVLVWTVISFALGHFIGHRTAINRDKRKEYNAMVSPVRLELMKQIESINSNDFYTTRFTKDQILLISDMLKRPKSDQLLSVYKKYSYATSYEGLKSDIGEYGIISIGDTSQALTAAIELLKLIPMR